MSLQKETRPQSVAHGRWYEDACGTAFALELVGERWSLLVLRELMFGGRRFGELRAGLPGISAKVLTERLDSLEAAGILSRRQLAPPLSAQLYELTPWGYAAEPAIQELGRWAAKSPDHDPTLPLSAASLMMSLRTMFDAALAGSERLSGALLIGSDRFHATVRDGELFTRRGEIVAPGFTMVAPRADLLAAAFYGKLPLESLAADGLRVEGDRNIAERFIGLFHLPEKIVGGARQG